MNKEQAIDTVVEFLAPMFKNQPKDTIELLFLSENEVQYSVQGNTPTNKVFNGNELASALSKITDYLSENNIQNQDVAKSVDLIKNLLSFRNTELSLNQDALEDIKKLSAKPEVSENSPIKYTVEVPSDEMDKGLYGSIPMREVKQRIQSGQPVYFENVQVGKHKESYMAVTDKNTGVVTYTPVTRVQNEKKVEQKETKDQKVTKDIPKKPNRFKL